VSAAEGTDAGAAWAQPVNVGQHHRLGPSRAAGYIMLNRRMIFAFCQLMLQIGAVH